MWQVEFCDEFAEEFLSFAPGVRKAILARVALLGNFGPELVRPYSDVLIGSDYPNMKELRCPVGREVWRVAYAFDPARKAIVLTGSNKAGKNQARFYRDLIAIADVRFAQHLKKRE
jgi:hypothetical protein